MLHASGRLSTAVTAVGRRALHTTPAAGSGGLADVWWGPEKAAGREVVGYGMTGDHSYADRLDNPYPAIRFRKDDDTILALRAKEKGDWKQLSMEEKKTLYRYSFKKTFAEYEAPDGHWKLVLAGVLGLAGVTIWFQAFLDKFVFRPLPPTFAEYIKEQNLWDQIDTFQEPITGVSSKWDYENNRWKA